MYDELELDLVGDRKTALFFIISDTDATFNFLVSMAYTQLFNLLCERADDKYGGRCVWGPSARPCAVPDRRGRQYRADSKPGKVDGNDPVS